MFLVAPKALAASVAATASVLLTLYILHDRRRRERAKWVEKEKQEKEDETLPSIIEHFREFQLDYGSTISEANKRRTTKYYEMARDAHMYDLVVGVRSYPRLRNRREDELKRIMKYHRKGNMSHRTVIVMCDTYTSQMLCEARQHIFEPLNYLTDKTTSNVWIPDFSIMPEKDMHVTVAIPWWWHTIRPGNRQLSEELVARFRQAVVLEFHHAFQIELERIVLLGGKALVALWRCIGERKTEDGSTIYDRHGEGGDPFVKLRRDIVRCFTTGASDFGKEPLTYSHRHSGLPKLTREHAAIPESPPPMPKRESNERANTIELKTPGLGDHDGFIHTTLARLPLDCLSMKDVELGPIHRLCREATATYCGHRMVVSKFRFLETTAAGGESNPCVDPIFDETIEAPPRIEVAVHGAISETTDLHAAKNVERSVTIGALPEANARGSLDGLFDEPLFDEPLSDGTFAEKMRRDANEKPLN